MGVLKYDGSDNTRFGTLTTALANTPQAAWTCAVLIKKSTDTTWQGQTYLYSVTASEQQAGFSINNANQAQCDTLHGGNVTSTATFTGTNVRIIAISKATGAVVPEISFVDVTAGGGWTHQNMSTTVGNGLAATRLSMGEWVGSDLSTCWMGLVGWWNVALSQAQKAALSTNKQTSDWWTNAGGQPVALIECNVAETSLVDLAGNATGLTAGGAALDSGETLASWNFDGTGVVVPPGVARHDFTNFPKFLLRRAS